MGRDILDNAFQGYNACIFAYGQTGKLKCVLEQSNGINSIKLANNSIIQAYLNVIQYLRICLRCVMMNKKRRTRRLRHLSHEHNSILNEGVDKILFCWNRLRAVNFAANLARLASCYQHSNIGKLCLIKPDDWKGANKYYFHILWQTLYISWILLKFFIKQYCVWIYLAIFSNFSFTIKEFHTWWINFRYGSFREDYFGA